MASSKSLFLVHIYPALGLGCFSVQFYWCVGSESGIFCIWWCQDLLSQSLLQRKCSQRVFNHLCWSVKQLIRLLIISKRAIFLWVWKNWVPNTCKWCHGHRYPDTGSQTHPEYGLCWTTYPGTLWPCWGLRVTIGSIYDNLWLKLSFQDFPGGPVVKTVFPKQGLSFDPRLRN